MVDKADIHNRKQRLESTTKNLTRTVSEHNAELILNCVKALTLKNSLSIDRQLFYMNRLKKFTEWLNKPLDSVTKENVEDYVLNLSNGSFREWTIQGKKLAVRTFYRWLGKPALVDWIKLTMKKNNQDADTNPLTQEDVDAMINACDCARDRAIISVLYESGARIGEFLNMRMSNIEFLDKGVKIKISGKTGRRTNLLIQSAGYLAEWINHHPMKKVNNVFVWVSRHNKNGSVNKPLCYRRFRELLTDIAKRAGVDKRVHPHAFRHARATFLANYWTEAQLCKWFGWAIGSEMPRVYINRAGVDTENAVLKLYGLSTKQDTVNHVLTCPRCKKENRTTDLYCSRCGLPLKEEAVKQTLSIERKMLDNVAEERIAELVELQVQKILMERGLRIKTGGDKDKTIT